MNESDDLFVINVIHALEKLNDARSIEPLKQVIKKGISYLSEPAAKALEKLDRTPVFSTDSPSEIDWKDIPEYTIRRLVKSNDQKDAEALFQWLIYTMAVLSKTKASEKTDIRKLTQDVIHALGRLKYTKICEPLIALLDTEGHYIKEDNDFTLISIGNEIRISAINALGNLGDIKAVEALIRMLNKPEDEVKKAAIDALRQLGDTRAIEPLKQIITKQRGYIREVAATALERLGTKPVFSTSSPSGVDLSPSRQRDEVIRFISNKYPILYSMFLNAGRNGYRITYDDISTVIEKYPDLSHENLARDPGVLFSITNTLCPNCKRNVDIICCVTVVAHLAPAIQKHIYFELHCPICSESGSNSYSI